MTPTVTLTHSSAASSSDVVVVHPRNSMVLRVSGITGSWRALLDQLHRRRDHYAFVARWLRLQSRSRGQQLEPSRGAAGDSRDFLGVTQRDPIPRVRRLVATGIVYTCLVAHLLYLKGILCLENRDRSSFFMIRRGPSGRERRKARHTTLKFVWRKLAKTLNG